MLFWTQFYAGRFSPSNRYSLSRQQQPSQLSESPVTNSGGGDNSGHFRARNLLCGKALGRYFGDSLHDRQVATNSEPKPPPKSLSLAVFMINANVTFQDSQFT